MTDIVIFQNISGPQFILLFLLYGIAYTIKGFFGIGASLVVESLVITPAALLGSYAGIRLFKSMPSTGFFRAFRFLLIVLSVTIVLRHILTIL